jgi:hypothetical protein
MEYLGPPRGAVNLLKFFASEPDFETVIGDLSEGFQKQASAFGQADARRWYWRETLRNAAVFAGRELRRTPFTVVVVTVFIQVALQPVLMAAEAQGSRIHSQLTYRGPLPISWYQVGVIRLLIDWYRDSVIRFLPAVITISAGASVSHFLKARELSLIIAFAAVVTCRTLTWRYSGVLMFGGEILSWYFYSLGCLWIRYDRLPDQPSKR